MTNGRDLTESEKHSIERLHAQREVPGESKESRRERLLEAADRQTSREMRRFYEELASEIR